MGLANDAAAPKDIRDNALRTAWARAAMLKQDAVVASLTPALLALDERGAAEIHAYSDATDPVERQFALVHQGHKAQRIAHRSNRSSMEAHNLRHP